MGLLSSIKDFLFRPVEQGSDSKGAKSSQHHEHNGFSIETQPLKEGGSFRVQGWIRKTVKNITLFVLTSLTALKAAMS